MRWMDRPGETRSDDTNFRFHGTDLGWNFHKIMLLPEMKIFEKEEDADVIAKFEKRLRWPAKKIP